jgi:hypothetical protein
MFAQSWEVHIVMQQVCKKMVINIAVCVVIHTPWLHGHFIETSHYIVFKTLGTKFK